MIFHSYVNLPEGRSPNNPISYPQILNISRLQQPRFGILPLRQLQAPQVAAAQRLQGLWQQVLRLAKADFATEKVGISVDFPGESDGIEFTDWSDQLIGRRKKWEMKPHEAYWLRKTEGVEALKLRYKPSEMRI